MLDKVSALYQSGWVLKEAVIKHFIHRKKSQVVTSLWLNGVLMAVLISLCSYGGLVMFSLYRHCDPVTAGQVTTILSSHWSILSILSSDWPRWTARTRCSRCS